MDRLGQPRVIIGPDDAAEEMGDEPASGVVLFELRDAHRTGTLEYEYDFGDAWRHLVEVMGPAELPAGAVHCIGGGNRGPVGDSGGTYGYARLIGALADPAHEDHRELSDWYEFATGQDAGTFEAPTRSTPVRSTSAWTDWRNDSGRNRPRSGRSTPSSVLCSGC